MNWIDRLFGKKESSPLIKFEELPDWLEARSRKISEGISRQASSIYSDIEEALAKIKESTTLLEDAEPEGRYHLKMVKVAVSNRDNMARQVRMLLENITIQQAVDVKSVMGFHENAIQTLTVCLENMMKSYQYTKLVFLEESKQVIADVNALGRLLNELIEPVNTQKNVLDAIENASTIIKNIKNISSAIELGEKAITEYGQRISLLKKELEDKQTALTRLRDGESWKQYNNYKDELVLLENNAGKKESEIKGLISPLNKGLGRLKQLSDSGRYTLKSQSRESLNLSLSDPLNASPEFFIEFQKIVESGTLNLTPEKTNKILEQTKLVLASLDSLKTEYQALTQDIEKQKEKISGLKVADEETGLEKSIVDLKDKINALEKELGSTRDHVESLKCDIESKRQELQRCISVIDSRVRIL